MRPLLLVLAWWMCDGGRVALARHAPCDGLFLVTGTSLGRPGGAPAVPEFLDIVQDEDRPTASLTGSCGPTGLDVRRRGARLHAEWSVRAVAECAVTHRTALLTARPDQSCQELRGTLRQPGRAKPQRFRAVRLACPPTAEASCPALQAVELVAGLRHTCAVLRDGTVRCWGRNDAGQLGDGTRTDRAEPVAVAGLGDVADLALGDAHGCARLHTGQVMCWGANEWGQLGRGGSGAADPAPQLVAGLSEVAEIAAGAAHTCARLADGSLRCWGYNGLGQLGDGTTDNRATPAMVPLPTPATRVSAGGYHTCARLADGGAACWGNNQSGQLGDGTTTSRAAAAPVGGLTDVTSLAAGRFHTCAVLGDATVRCWGSDGWGQVGYERNRNDPVLTPMQPPNHGSGATNIAAGAYQTCTIGAGGKVTCWGRLPSSAFPINVRDAVEVTVGLAHTCVRLHDATVRCWGDDGAGQLGEGRSAPQSALAAPAMTPPGVRQVWAGGARTCVAIGEDTVRCWGIGRVGDAGSVSDADEPRLPGRVVQVASGPRHSCACTAAGQVWCWGDNESGQLGDGTRDGRLTPVQALGIEQAAEVVTGGAHTCARSQDGAVRCWGRNSSGQLGNGTLDTANLSVGPTGLAGVRQLVAGYAHTCALLGDGTAACWGSDRGGELGGGSLGTLRVVPAPVVGLRGAVALAAGAAHTCALLGDGTVSCWGWNLAGQLGDPELDRRPTPATVRGVRSAVGLVAGDAHTCAGLADGRVRCWGANWNGQVGAGETGPPLLAHDVTGLPHIGALAAGAAHTCALAAAGGVFCWGSDAYGQLGTARQVSRSWAVPVVR